VSGGLIHTLYMEIERIYMQKTVSVYNGSMFGFFRQLTLVLILGLVATPVYANQTDLLFGQRHSYKVVFRGNGEAVVYAHITANNTADKPLEELALEFPGIHPQELIAFQQHVNPGCTEAYCPLSKPQRPEDALSSVIYPQTSAYKKLSYKQEGLRYVLKLDKAAAADQAATVVLAYTTKGYAAKSLGRYEFNFQTLKSTERIATAQVAVDVDSDLRLKGFASQVNFNQVDQQSVAVGVTDGRNLDSVISNIGYGAIVKQASNLAPGETLSVKGQYASHWWGLYWSELATVAAIALMLVLALWLRARRHPKTSASHWNLATLLARPPFVSGLVSAAAVVGLSLLVRQWMQSRYGYMDPLVTLVGTVVILVVYGLIILGPSVWMVVKGGGIRPAFMALVWQLIGYTVFLALYLMLFQSAPPQYYNPLPVEDLGREGDKYE
jgi:hypothetical protein